MGLLDAIRSLLGLSGGSDDRREGDGELTVEHDPPAPSNDPPPEPEPEPEPVASDDSPAAAGTDATASTGSMVDENAAGPNEAAEPPEATTATGPQVDPEAGGVAESDAGVESLVDEAEDDGAEAVDDETVGDEADQHDPVETVRGIGPAYADRLGDAGVETVSDLAAADPTALAAAIEVAESRVERWVDRARDRTA